MESSIKGMGMKRNNLKTRLIIFFLSYILTCAIFLLIFAVLKPSSDPLSLNKLVFLIVMTIGIIIIAPVFIYLLLIDHPLSLIAVLILYSTPFLLFYLSQKSKELLWAYIFSGLSGCVSALICCGAFLFLGHS